MSFYYWLRKARVTRVAHVIGFSSSEFVLSQMSCVLTSHENKQGLKSGWFYNLNRLECSLYFWSSLKNSGSGIWSNGSSKQTTVWMWINASRGSTETQVHFLINALTITRGSLLRFTYTGKWSGMNAVQQKLDVSTTKRKTNRN